MENKMADAIDPKFMKSIVSFSYSLQFLDFTFTIHTDQPSSLICFQKMYANFQVPSPIKSDECSDYYVINDPLLWEKPFIWADKKTYTCPKSSMLPAYAHLIISNSVMARIHSHLLFHAAGVSWQGKGIIIIGASGFGKSTLTFELMRRGFHFLTDEITCLHRRNHFLYPFPRNVSLRRSALPLFKGIDESCLMPLPMISGEHKTMMQLSDIPGVRISEPCLPKYLICLSPASDQSDGSDSASLKNKGEMERSLTFSLAVDRLEDQMIADILNIPEVIDVQSMEERAFPQLKITCQRGSFVLPKIEGLCYQYQVALFDVAKEERKGADYSRKPRLEKIPKSMAIMELLKGFRGGWKSQVIQGNNSSVTSLVFELSHMLAEVACYRLTLGGLKDMADLVNNLVMERHSCRV